MPLSRLEQEFISLINTATSKEEVITGMKSITESSWFEVSDTRENRDSFIECLTMFIINLDITIDDIKHIKDDCIE